ncbi:alpha/beta hydrolase [Nocardioides sp.]|uniref:alpha/beta hydrolase family protein n=1 Tax=Nocardioides sp. TaxID=35761 RepID=UPI00321A2BF7
MTGASTDPVERITYGDDPSQFADLHLPEGEPRGVVVVIHGGFWLAQYDYTLGTPLARSLAADGWAALNLEYRRVGNGGGAPTTFDDVAAGIDLLAGPELDLDTTTVVTLGHSAGGHLAAWAASRGRFPQWQGGVDVTHVISQAGVLDLVAADADGLGGGAVAGFLGHTPGPADAPLDPMQQVPLDQPLWCVHGTDDGNVPISQSERYVAAATAAGASAELVTIEGGDHFTLIDADSEAWARTLGILDTIG